jgi:HNH endonuclease
LHSQNEFPAGMFVDHLDDDGLNNQKSNLKIVSPRENTQRYHSQLHPR